MRDVFVAAGIATRGAALVGFLCDLRGVEAQALLPLRLLGGFGGCEGRFLAQVGVVVLCAREFLGAFCAGGTDQSVEVGESGFGAL